MLVSLGWGRLTLGIVVATAIVAACGGDDDDDDASAAAGASANSGGSSGNEAGAAATAATGAWNPTDGGPVSTQQGVEVTDDTGSFVCYVTTCADHELQCGDCEDNDGDGLIDAHDPECLGPCDNTEGPGLYSDVGGAVGDSCGVDCYFDFGNGPGNDQCVWDHGCDPLEPEVPTCPYDETLLGGHKCPDEQDPLCAEICMPYTPNGCDCFGCCTFPELATAGPDGGAGYVWIGALDGDNVSTCTFDDVLDPEACPPCTPIDNCLNPCGPCEVCVGRPLPPPECFEEPDAGEPPADSQCPEGVRPCGLEGQDPCPGDYYCVTGCCQPVVQ